MKQIIFLFVALTLCSTIVRSQEPVAATTTAAARPLRLAIAGLSHGHVRGILGRAAAEGVQIVGIHETDSKLADRYAQEYKFSRDLVYTDLGKMLDATKPEAVAAFGSTYDHLKVVEASAERGLPVMVEKPLAVSLEHALAIEALAKKHQIHVLTNYETTWYPSTQGVYDLVYGQQALLGPIRKIVVHDGHPGPKEIGVNAEFLKWLTDPVLNGAGALMDFGCYGANLATWLMKGAEPLTVTAVTQQIKPEVYPAVDDEATIILKYPQAQVIIQASWNWTFNRKDIEVYGRSGQVHALDGTNMRVRTGSETEDRLVVLERSASPTNRPFTYLTAVVRGQAKNIDGDLSSLANNLTVMRILDAAKRSAASGKTINLASP